MWYKNLLNFGSHNMKFNNFHHDSLEPPWYIQYICVMIFITLLFLIILRNPLIKCAYSFYTPYYFFSTQYSFAQSMLYFCLFKILPLESLQVLFCEAKLPFSDHTLALSKKVYNFVFAQGAYSALQIKPTFSSLME